MEYNTQLSPLILPEYGRHIQKMVEFCCELKTKEDRNKCARAIIDVMGNLIPQLRDVADFKHKLWDHLFVISEFKLDVDSPYPIPVKEVYETKSERLQYPKKNIKYKHYGKSVELMVEKCINTTDDVQKEEFTEALANHMKKMFLTWNRDSVNDEVVFDHLEILSKGKLKLKENTNLRSTKDILSVIRPANAPQQHNHGHKKKKKKRPHN